MKAIDIFFQREGVRDIGHLEADPKATLASIKARLIEQGAAVAETLLFAEDNDNVLGSAQVVTNAGVGIHVAQACNQRAFKHASRLAHLAGSGYKWQHQGIADSHVVQPSQQWR